MAVFVVRAWDLTLHLASHSSLPNINIYYPQGPCGDEGSPRHGSRWGALMLLLVLGLLSCCGCRLGLLLLLLLLLQLLLKLLMLLGRAIVGWVGCM